MKLYNVILTECKTKTVHLNLTEEELLDILWMWTFEDDLWYYLEDNPMSEEGIRDYLWNYFIPENVFHEYEEDEIDCYAFYYTNEEFYCKDGKILTYNNYSKLADFIVNKIKEKGYELLCSNSTSNI